jgi:hypothetical protein
VLDPRLNVAARRGEWTDRVVRIEAFSAVVDDAAFPALAAMVLMQLTDAGAAAPDLVRVRPHTCPSACARSNLAHMYGGRV